MTPRISGLILVLIVVMKVTILCLMSSGCTFGGPSGTGFEDLGSGYPFLRTLAPRISTFEGFYRLSLAGWLAGWLAGCQDAKMTPRISGLILVLIVVMKVTILCLMSSGCTFGGPSGTGFEDLGSGYPFLRTLAPRISTF